ncbi:hypothetical protein ACEWY4_009152 [Coilia grayii]|uniref:Rho-GAP domain-containing protein n=1 Tax=Coilia grayii TaxID=363190 RepID=A0ABD1K5N3_9TELE
MSVKGEKEQLRHIQSVIKELPAAHLRTLEYLSRHLSHLATLSHLTNMHARNLALVWAPNLLRCKDMEQASSCSGDSAFLEVRVQQSVVEFILKHTLHIFGPSADERTPHREAPGAMVAEKYATLPVSCATSCGSLKLMSLEEAQARSLGASHPARQRENSLPDTRMAATLYHTVIDLNDSKRKLSSKSSKRWKSIFGLGRSAKLSRNGSVLVRAQDNEKAAIRPSKSMDSICSLSLGDGDMPSAGNSGGSSSGGGACNGLPIKSRTLGSEADFSLSEENLKVWGFSPKSPKKSVSSAASSPSNTTSSEVGNTATTSQKTLPEQLKVFKGDEASGSFRPTSPKNRRMLFSSSSHHSSGGGTIVGSAPHLSFFPLESPSLSPRHQRKALNISEPFAVSVPLRVSAVISANSTPCRPGGSTSSSLNPNQGLKPAKVLCPPEPGHTGGQSAPDASPTSTPKPTLPSHPSPAKGEGEALTPPPGTSHDVTGATVGASGSASVMKEEGAFHQDAAAAQGTRAASLHPSKCLLAGLEEMLCEVGASPPQVPVQDHPMPKIQSHSQSDLIPNPTPKILGEGATPEPSDSGPSAVSNMPLNLTSTKDPSAGSAPSRTRTATTPTLAQESDLVYKHGTDAQALVVTVPPQTSNESQPSSAAPLSEPSYTREGKGRAPQSDTDVGPSGLTPERRRSGSGELVDVCDDGNLQKNPVNRDEMTTESQMGIQGETQKGSMTTVRPENELQILKNIPEENLVSVQPSNLNSPGTFSPSDSLLVSADQSAQTPADTATHQAPPLLEFGPPLSHLGALRETDILSDLEEILTSTPNQSDTQASTKDHKKEPVLVGPAVSLQTSCEAEGKAKDLNARGHDMATSETTPTVVKVLGDVKPDVPGKMSLNETLSETKKEDKDTCLVKVEEREQKSRRKGKERKQKEREKEKGLDQVELWEDLMHTQWVTSPLHTPTIEEMFSGLANQNKKSVSQATVPQLPPEAVQPPKMAGPSPKMAAVSRRNEATACRRNSSPLIPLHQSEGRAETSQNALVQWALKVPASTAAATRRFQRQASYDSSLYPSSRLHPFPEQRLASRPSGSLASAATRHRPCSLDLERDLDFVFDTHGNLSSHPRVIRDISNQPNSQQNVPDVSTMKDQSHLVGHRDLGSVPWHTSTGDSADFSEELELFLCNPRAPARRNSAPPPVGVASVRAPLTIRTSQAKAVPVIPPKVQYSSVPGSTGPDLKNIPDRRKDSRNDPEGHKDSRNVPEGRKDSKTAEEKLCGSIAVATAEVHPPLSSGAEEERENREPVPQVPPSPTAMPASPCSPPSPAPTDPLALRRKHSPSVEPSYPDQMHLPLSSSALLRQRPSFRNRPRPQSLVLFSPPFPIMDPPNNAPMAPPSSSFSSSSASLSSARPHSKASTGLGRAASFWDRPSHRQEESQSPRRDKSGCSGHAPEGSTRERVENRKGSEGAAVVLRGGSASGSGSGGCGKMTLPKSGQRLETSPSSCFYQPQRRSMVLDNRASRQIE